MSQLQDLSITTFHTDVFGGCWCLAPLEDIIWNIAPPLQLLCAWYVCMYVPGDCAAQLHETDIWPRDCATVWLDLMRVVHNLTIVWPLRPVARDRQLTWESAQLRETDIWPGNLPSCTRRTIDLGICPVARDKHLTLEVAATWLDYVWLKCVHTKPRGSGPCKTTKPTTPHPIGITGCIGSLSQACPVNIKPWKRTYYTKNSLAYNLRNF